MAQVAPAGLKALDRFRLTHSAQIHSDARTISAWSLNFPDLGWLSACGEPASPVPAH